MRKILPLLLASLVAALPLPARTLTVENVDFRSDLVFRSHRFVGAGFTDLRTGAELSAGVQEALFELCIDGRVVTSADPVWNYAGQTRRVLANGGVVTSFSFCGRGELKGLTLVWDREVFPEGAFVRERLRLTSDPGRTFRLTHRDRACHLVFPRYSFASEGPVAGKELRIGTFRPARVFPDHHMFHPDSTLFEAGPALREVKGPFLVLSGPSWKLVTSYEHASQDHADVMSVSKTAMAVQTVDGNDGSQGVEGDVQALKDDDLWFISSFVSQSEGRLVLGNRVRHGGYLDGERIPSGGSLDGEGPRSGWYGTVWSTLSILPPDADENEAIADYLLNRITENRESRVADFYYNTWGMQRHSKTLYPIMNEGRLREEMRYAVECGVSTFVIDDGWQVDFGQWVCNTERIPCGLGALCAFMDSLGLRPGIWMSLPGAGRSVKRTLEHPDWIIRDQSGEPILGQWKKPVYDLVGPCYEALLGDLKALCDEGIRFFKWDAMNLLSSTLPGLDHGDATYSPRERADRYNYLLPFYVTSLMRELRAYCPGTVVEIDLTEPERCLVGLQVLQEGKYYFINNGSSKYDDYSTYRTKSVRSAINRFASFMPQELFTYAFYPHDEAGAQEYNITSALTAGHGIWGDLSMMTSGQRAVVKRLFEKASRVLPHVWGSRVEVVGSVGDTPEIYVQRAPSDGWALLTAFGSAPASSSGGDASSYPFTIGVRSSEVLGVLGHPYRLGPDGVELMLSFAGSDDCASAFVLGGKGSGPQVYSSTGCLEAIEPAGSRLRVTAATDAEVSVGMPDGRLLTRFLPAGETAIFQ